MEAIMALATVLQLIGLFRQERSATADLSHKDFYEWLVEHRFQELKDLISETYHLSSEVDKLLREDHAVMLEKLDAANAILADILRHVEGFREIAETMLPNFALSSEAVELLRLFAESGDDTLIPTPWHGKFLLLPSKRYISFTETRFMDDDFDSLTTHGLLIHLHVDSTNTPGYRLTRRAMQFLKLREHKAN